MCKKNCLILEKMKWEGSRELYKFDSLDDKIDDLYYYMQYIKFGFGRASRDASFYPNGEMSREDVLELIKNTMSSKKY